MQLLQLKASSDNTPVFIAPSHIAGIRPIYNQGKFFATNISLNSGFTYQVAETPQQIFDCFGRHPLSILSPLPENDPSKSNPDLPIIWNQG